MMTDEEAESALLSALQQHKTMLEHKALAAPECERATISADVQCCKELYEEVSRNFAKKGEEKARESD
jgi:hypothetical protein